MGWALPKIQWDHATWQYLEVDLEMLQIDFSYCSMSSKTHPDLVWHPVDIDSDQAKAFGVGAVEDSVGPCYPAGRHQTSGWTMLPSLHLGVGPELLPN